MNFLEKTITQLERKRLIEPEVKGKQKFKARNIRFVTVVKNSDWQGKVNPNFPQYFISKGASYDSSILQAHRLKLLKSFSIDPMKETAAYVIHGEIMSIAQQGNVLNIVVRQSTKGYDIVKWSLSRFKSGKYLFAFKTPNGRVLSNEFFFLQRK